ncbi:MAG: hypothetical protein C7B45_14160 [Sulfobacillus acidophilus]|uniref:Uncharacterized protein n=1 Tax=Sulfobacillus acidophilus TaxID=53633 RepID=A0A2T2WEH5_9FIRM|nr:MAG: hypothetical protein C7B45_14160 [Sulfobacillus acidophilus]
MRNEAMNAVYYREWRMNRALYLATAALMVLPSCLSVFANATAPHRYAREFLTSWVLGYAHGAGLAMTFGVLLSGVLGLFVFWYDKSRGGIEAALQGPLSRRALMTGKLTLGLATLVAAQVFVWLLLMATAVGVGHAGAIGALAQITVLALASSACLFALTLALSGAMGSLFFIALTAFLWLILPRTVATLITNLSYLSTRMTIAEATAMNTTARDLHWLSPLVTVFPTHNLALLYAAYFTLWTVAAIWAAWVWWERVPYERFHAPLYFSSLWNGWYALLALVTGFFLANLPRSLGAGRWTFWGLYGHALILALPAWFVWRWFWIRLGQSGLGLGPATDS